MTTPYIDPQNIFASDAPTQDKPPAFNNYIKGMDETRSNDGRPTIKQFNFIQQQNDFKFLYMHERGACLPFVEGFPYENNAIVFKDGFIQQKNGSSWVIPFMRGSQNLAELTDVAQARTKLDVYSKAETDAIVETLDVTDADITTWSGRTQRELNKSLNSSINNINSRNKFVSVKHVRKNGFIYDVITGIQPHQLEIKSNQISSDSPIMSRLTAKQASEKFNRPIVVNASAFKNADGTGGWNNELLVPNGIHIQAGKVITGWDYGTNILRNQAVCLMDTGELKRFYRDTSAQEMVEQGAILGQSWGAWLVYDGVVPDDFETSVINDAEKSAKTVIFQMPDKSIGFLLIEGVTGSYGATSAEAGQICLELGVKCAYSLDGGGSSQCWWGNSYAMASSDATTRTLSAYLTVNVASVLPYDSGFIPIAHNSAVFGDAVSDNSKPPLFLRQKSDEVTLYLNLLTSALPPSATTAITEGTAVPARYRSNTPIYSRALLLGGGGRFFTCYQGGGSYLGLLNVEPFDSTKIPTSLVGKLNWTQKHI